MSRRSIGAALLALAVIGAIAATATAASATQPHTARNGAIAFYAYSKIYAIKPDGSDVRILAPARKRNCVIPHGRQGSCLVGTFAWSPDGRRLAFLHRAMTATGGVVDAALYVIDADGRHERRVPGCGRPWPSCRDFSWSPDNSHVVVSRPDGLFVLGTRQHSMRRLTSSRTDESPLWSPDGTSIAFARGELPGSSTYVFSVDGGAATPVPGTSSAAACAWSPDSRSLLCQKGERILRIAADGRERPAELGRVPGAMAGLSRDSTRLTYVHYRLVHPGDRPPHSTYSTEIWTMTLSGHRRWRVYAGRPKAGGGPVLPIWSPDGDRVAFATDAIYVVRADGDHLRRLSSLGHESVSIVGELAWQPLP